ncbi:MAG TPA: histidine kinase, partial [Ramlibacter sp.]|nr:histidine kinase [Ramlibacter sp.]
MLTTSTPEQRLQQIEQARTAVLREGRGATELMVDAWYERSWLERSWRRCLASGRRPDEPVAFDLVPAQASRRCQEASHALLQAARPVLDKLGRAIANSRYFAILT